MRMLFSFHKILESLKSLEFISFFLIRLYLAYIFWNAGTGKLADVDKFSGWLGSLNIPFPEIMGWIVIGCEVGGSILLLVGLFVRWVTLPLLLILGTAVFTIHWDNGWSHENNGVELAATYSILLLVLLLSGGGKYLSLDYWVSLKK